MRFSPYMQEDVKRLKNQIEMTLDGVTCHLHDYDWELWVHKGDKDQVCVCKGPDSVGNVGYLMNVEEVAELLDARARLREVLSKA